MFVVSRLRLSFGGGGGEETDVFGGTKYAYSFL